MKKILLAILLMPFLMILSCKDQGKINHKNSLQLKNGMTKEELIEVMGKPNKVDNEETRFGDKSYYYESPLGASDGIYIYTKKDTITHIFYADMK